MIKRLIPDWVKRSMRKSTGAVLAAPASKRMPMSSAPLNLTVRPWQPGDTDQINAFYNDASIRPGAGASGNIPRTARQWQWEFETPASRSPRYVLAFDGERLIGTQGYIPVSLTSNGGLVRSGKSEDTLVHPDYRGLSVGDRMYDRLFEMARIDGVDLIWGFTATAVNLLRRNGFQFVSPFDVVQADVAIAAAACAKHRSQSSEITITDLERADDRCDAFASEFAALTNGLGIELSARFLQWRLLDNPFRQYHTLIAMQHGRMIGLAAFKREPRQRLAYLSELAVIPTASTTLSETIDALLMVGLDRLRVEGYTSLQARPAGPHPYNQAVRAILAKRGFNNCPGHKPSQFAVRALRDVPIPIHDASQWRLGEIMREF